MGLCVFDEDTGAEMKILAESSGMLGGNRALAAKDHETEPAGRAEDGDESGGPLGGGIERESSANTIVWRAEDSTLADCLPGEERGARARVGGELPIRRDESGADVRALVDAAFGGVPFFAAPPRRPGTGQTDGGRRSATWRRVSSVC